MIQRNQILNSYLESDVLGFGQFGSAVSQNLNDSDLLSSNKDDDHKLRDLKNIPGHQTKNLMLLFLEKDETDTENSLHNNNVDEECSTLINEFVPDEVSNFSQQNTKESVARFINAMASIKTGRDYISKCH